MADRTCVYCSQPATTLDHVPAKGLFPKPRPSDLITVPCCLRCNQQGARDDEYFRRVLFLRDDVQAHPQAARVWPTEVRAIEKPTKVGMRQSFRESLRRAEVVDRDGGHLGEQTVSLVERRRLALVASRVAKGLYYHVIGHALPRDHIATGVVDEIAADAANPEAPLSMASTIDQVRTALFKKPLTVLGDGVLSYACVFAEGDIRLSLWLLRFYEAATFLAMTEPRERVDPKQYQYDFPQPE